MLRLPTITIVITLAILACATTNALAAGGQLMNLPPVNSPRFTITDKIWPTNHGDADICLWKDDDFAAVSFTIDDNTVPDHAWWITTTETYDFKATWFVITYLVEANPGYFGPWSAFQDLYARGHDVQSHTVTHLNFDRGFDPDDPLHDITVEYAQSIVDVETNVPDEKVMTLAYPGGANTIYNDDAIAAQYYIAARGTVGTPNPANKVNYMRTNSMGQFYINTDDGGAAWNSFEDTILNPGHQNYRGWYCMHHHGISAMQDEIISDLDYIQQKDAEIGIWNGKFADVAQYGQERDTAELIVTSVADYQIIFTLADDMHDSYFTYPLTVKVRVNNDWTDVEATQDGNAIDAVIIEHEGNKFALVQAVPDQGEVSLIKGGSGIRTRTIFYNNSAFDNNDPAANADDDNAIATDKQALLPGQTATHANYTSYAKGINGIIIDIGELGGTLNASDFQFKVGNDSTPASWSAAPPTSGITTRPGQGAGGSDRVTITFTCDTIVGKWLEVKILANANTGLDTDDVFYFGNAPGETGNSATDAIVDATDEIACRNNLRNFMLPADVINPYDHNRDGKVDATDEIISRNNATDFTDDLELITP